MNQKILNSNMSIRWVALLDEHGGGLEVGGGVGVGGGGGP